MSTSILAPTTNPHKGTTTTSPWAFALDDVIVATITNPAGGLLTPAQATLQLSADGGLTFLPIDSKRGSMGDSSSLLLLFRLGDYAGLAPWTHARLVFAGNTAQSQLGVTVSAVGDGGTWSGGGTTGLTITQHHAVVGTASVAAGATTLDATSNDKWNVTLVNGTPTAVTLSGMVAGQTVRVAAIQDGTGSCTATWALSSGTLKWSGGPAPTLATGAGKIDVIVFECAAAGIVCGNLAMPNC